MRLTSTGDSSLRRLRHHMPQFGVLTGLFCCGSCMPTGDDPPVEPVFPADYRTTFTKVRDCRFSIEHGGVMIRVLANDIAAQGYLNNQNPLPVGSVLVKEEYNGLSCSDDAALELISAMRKEAAGYDPDDGDWHWQEVLPNRQIQRDGKTTCIDCHNRSECLARDYMCTEP